MYGEADSMKTRIGAPAPCIYSSCSVCVLLL